MPTVAPSTPLPTSIPTSLPSYRPSISPSPSQSPTVAPSSPSSIPSSFPSASPSSTGYKNIVTLFTFSSGSLSDSGPHADPNSQLDAPNGYSFVSGVSGDPLSAIYLNGNQYLSTTSSTLPIGSKTVSLWAKIDSSLLRRSTQSTSAPPGMYLLGFGTGCGSSFLLMLNSRNGQALFEVQARCDLQRVTVGSGEYKISDFYDLWTNFVVTTSNVGGTSLYINGKLLAHVSKSLTQTNVSAGHSVLGIGTVVSPSGTVPYSDTNTSYFMGALDTIGIYDASLSAAEVATLYTEQLPSVSVTDPPKPISTGSVIGASIGAIVGSIICCCLIYCIKNRMRYYYVRDHEQLRPRDTPRKPVKFTVGRLANISVVEVNVATNNFSEDLLLGSGSSAAVYRASIGGRSVAVKKLRNIAGTSECQEQLLHELGIFARLEHRNILPLLGVVMDPDCLCLVYPLQELGTLSHMLNDPQKRRTYLGDWRVRLCLGMDVAIALDFLHTRVPCIVHRDVKLTNILMREESGRLEAVLCDLSIARVFHEGGTLGENTRVMGTQGYIDPQYARGYQLNKSSDIFALGVVLLQMLTGISKAYDPNENPNALYLRMRDRLRTQSPNIADPNIWPHVLADYLGNYVSLCISETNEGRPESCRNVAEALHQMIGIVDQELRAPSIPN